MLTAFFIGLAAGFAATPHCLGMCGAFPLHLAKASGRGNLLLRQLLFLLGKTFTYAFLGALASAFGLVLFRNTALSSAAAAFRLAAGVLVVLIGLVMLGMRLPKLRALQRPAETGLVRSLYAGFLATPGPAAAFVLGVAVGFLPCPLPIGMLAAAAASHHVPAGIAGMAGVGLGTVPGLLAAGLFGTQLDRRLAKVGMRAAGVLVVALGLLTVGRASGVIHPKAQVNHVVPPCCQGHEAR